MFKKRKDESKQSRREKIKNKRNIPYNRTNRLLLSFSIFIVIFFFVSSFSNNDFDWQDPNDEDYGIVVENDEEEKVENSRDKNSVEEKPDEKNEEENEEVKEEVKEDVEEDIEKEYEYGDIQEDTKEEEEVKTLEEDLNEDTEKHEVKGELYVHYIDVGQGDSMLIKEPNGEYVLIDGGPRSASKKLVNYLHNQGVVEISKVIATHPHEDHIGGLVEVLNTFPVDEIYMPNITHTTETFKNLLKAIDKNDVELMLVENERVISSDSSYSNKIVFPIKDTNRVFKDKKNLNLYSVVNYVSFGKTSFLFTGDAEVPVENYLANKYKGELQTTVLKVGHHGSNTSSSEYFLDMIKPKLAVITSAKDNSYGHPHKEVMDRLKERNMKIYNTQDHGDIVIKSDGKKIKVKTSK